jgi:hypothetical protein
MIHFLDDLLRTLFLKNIPGWTIADGRLVGFVPPDSDWVSHVAGLDRTALNVYLVGFSEKLDLRSNGRTRTFGSGGVIQETRDPRRLDCHYMITAWNPAATSPPPNESTLAEHERLHQAATVLINATPMVARKIYGAQPFPTGFPEVLKDAELPSEFLPCEGFPTTIDLWNTMAQPWRPALNLTVTLPLLFGKPFEEHMVTTRIAMHGQIDGSGIDDVLIEIGGHVITGTPPKPVPTASVQLETQTAEPLQTAESDTSGRFTFAGLDAGIYVLRVRATGHPEATRTIAVPSPTGDYDVQLS